MNLRCCFFGSIAAIGVGMVCLLSIVSDHVIAASNSPAVPADTAADTAADTPADAVSGGVSQSGVTGSVEGNVAEQSSAAADPAVARVLAIEADSDYGEYLAGECLACHQPHQAGAVPSIHSSQASHIVTELLRFKSGDRNNPTMTNVAKALGDEEIAALAKYFSNL